MSQAVVAKTKPEIAAAPSTRGDLEVRLRRGAEAIAVPAVALDSQLDAEFGGLADEVSWLIDRAELTGALDLIWQRVRRLNRYVEERAPWQLARDPEQAGALDQTLASLAEGLRAVTVLLHPYMPQSTERLHSALIDAGASPFAFERAGKIRLRQRRALVRRECLIAHHRQCAGKTFRPQRSDCLRAGLPGSDDDDPLRHALPENPAR